MSEMIEKKLKPEERERLRFCFVPHDNCEKTCEDYLECDKYKRDRLKFKEEYN